MDNLTKDKIQKLIDSNPLMVFMKGTKLMPQCGFSQQCSSNTKFFRVRIWYFWCFKWFRDKRRYQRIFRLANNSSSLFKRRISWWIRYSYWDVQLWNS